MFIQRYILFQLFYTQGFPPDPKALPGTEFFKLSEKGEHFREWQEKENGQTIISDDLSVLAPLVGLEPTTP